MIADDWWIDRNEIGMLEWKSGGRNPERIDEIAGIDEAKKEWIRLHWWIGLVWLIAGFISEINWIQEIEFINQKLKPSQH